MAKGQKGIFITEAEFKVLQQARKHFTLLTGAEPSWGAYLVALAAGSLATFAIKGFELRCPSCETIMQMRLVQPSLEPNEVFSAPSPSSSRERPATRKR